jgi:hypothetical protein
MWYNTKPKTKILEINTMARLSKKTVSKIHKMIADGETTSNIASAANVDYQTAYYYVRKQRDSEKSKLDVQPKDYEVPQVPDVVDSNPSELMRFKGAVIGAAVAFGVMVGIYIGVTSGTM